MKTYTKEALIFALLTAALAIGCDEENPSADGGPDVDAGPDDMQDGGPPGNTPTCDTYCDTITTNCTGENAVYADRADCMDVCTTAGWPAGDEVTGSGPASGHSIGCRTYHGGAPAVDDPVMHCPHAGETGANVCGTWCDVYCGMAMNVCTGGDAIYGSMDECMSACGALDTSGELGATSGDTMQCRLYHLGVAIREDDPAMHCPHAAADGGGVCVGGWTFRTDDPTDYTRVDRMGMPAVSTALVSADTKNAYNDGDPSDDAALTFAGDLIANLEAIHTALDDDLVGATLVPCSMATDPGASPLPFCLSQPVTGTAGGPAVASLVVPDTITIDTNGTAGFPNGRLLTDPVIDVTLSVILLDLTAATQDATTLVGTNPVANDVEFSDTFPYLAPPFEP